MLLISVGVTGIEPATSRPPDAHSNRTELHPELRVQKYYFFLTLQVFYQKNALQHKKNTVSAFLESQKGGGFPIIFLILPQYTHYIIIVRSSWKQ